MKKTVSLTLCAAVSMLIVACGDSSEVKKVKGGVLQLCPNHTVEQMVEGFMGSPSWKTGKGENGIVFVNIEGDITFHDKPVRALVQFIINGDNFSFSAFEMNGVPSANMIAIGLLNKMCLSAVGNTEKSAPETTNKAATSPVAEPPSAESCVAEKMLEWEKQRESEIRNAVEEAEKHGEEFRISAGQDEAVRQDALSKITAQCR